MGIPPAPNASPPLFSQDDKHLFQRNIVDDSLHITQDRKRKSQIGTSHSNTKSLKNPLQAIPSVGEINETEKINNNHLKEGSYTSKQLSMQSRSRSQRYTISLRTDSQKVKDDTKHDFKYRTDTYRQYNENNNSPLNEEQFHNKFEKACDLKSYYPQYNKDQIIQKYKSYQLKKVAYSYQLKS